jgi:predicted anti-sigma-YlaC factor YlaD
MDCQEAKTGLSPYLDGELPRDDAAGIASHLTGCDECRRWLEELRLVGTLIRAQVATRDTPEVDLLATVMAAIAHLPPTRPAQRVALHRRLMWRRLRRVWPGTR